VDSMEGYLGEKIIPIEQTPFNKNTIADWCLYFVGSYGQIDGAHHKQWVLDQVARICNGTSVIISQASWSNGSSEWRITLDEPSQVYTDWVQKMRFDEDGEEYSYDEGEAP
jgi:hypothetical protein